jgi:hypothetical protein
MIWISHVTPTNIENCRNLEEKLKKDRARKRRNEIR